MAPESAGRGYGAQISRIGRAAGPAEFSARSRTDRRFPRTALDQAAYSM